MKKTILLTGPSGAVGREALAELVQRSEQYEIRIFDRPVREAQKVLKPYLSQVQPFWGDLRDKMTMGKDLFDGVDAVIHLGALIPPEADLDDAVTSATNTEGTCNLIAGLEQFSPHARFLYSSSISVYGDRVDDPMINVGDPLVPSVGDYYAKTKIAAEEAIVESSLKWSIFRLTGIMNDSMKMDPLMFHMPLASSFEIATTRDTGYAMVQAIECDEILGSVFNLAGGVSCRVKYKDFLNEMFTIFGLGPDLLPRRAFADRNFHCGFYEDGDKLQKLLGFQRDSLQDYYAMVKKQVPAIQRLATSLTRPIARLFLLNQSEPYQAWKKNDKEQVERYYKDTP
jgi:nucleoside-diphosphate-sugar epimerase